MAKQQQSSYGGRWVLDKDGQQMVFVVEENFPPIPKQIIQLPNPPSDCGSAFMSDGSLTVSHHFGRSNTFDDTIDVGNDEDDDHDDNINYNDNTNDGDGNASSSIERSTAIETVESSDLEGQNSTFRRDQQRHHYHHHQQQKQSSFVKNKSIKKKVTLVVPEKDWKEEEDQPSCRLKQNKRKACCRTAAYCLFGLSLLAIVVGGGISAMIYFDIISIGNGNHSVGSNSNNHSNDGANSISDTIVFESDSSNDISTTSSSSPPMSSPIVVSEPTIIQDANSPTDGPIATAAPTLSAERIIITGMLTDQFRVTLPENDPLAPANQAVDWMVEELKSFSSKQELLEEDYNSNSNSNNDNQVSEYYYDDLAKFGQRFSIITMQYALLGEKVANDEKENGNNNDDGSVMVMQPPRSLLEQNNQQGVDECNWEGVTCDEYGRVVGVDFSDDNLTGSIPSEIRLLYKLQTLDLSSNSIVGSIPQEVYDLRDLERLYLYQNKLTGTISSWIGQLNSLQYLHLSHNSLTGSIPPQLRSQSDDEFRPLKYLNFYDNKLTGTIPKNLKLRDLYYFDIGRNFIGGSIPEDVGTDFIKLRYLHIDHNRLTETIPETIPPMADGRLISFLANHNRLEGLVPDNWTMINKLVQYTLHENYFDYLGPDNCNFNVFAGGQLVEFKADCDICSCNDIFCDAMCSSD